MFGKEIKHRSFPFVEGEEGWRRNKAQQWYKAQECLAQGG